nr:ribonuclease H-like domain-containing protein [Tanacetum cinerariifolium]
MEYSNNTPTKIPILDTGKFEQWKFRIQQYLQHKHYALWEVIEFEDSYVVPTNNIATVSASEGTATKKGRTVALTTKDMQKRRNDVKSTTTLLLAFPDEHQLRFSKYKMAQELWAAILKTSGGRREKDAGADFQQTAGNRKQLEFIDAEIEQDDLNQKLLTNLSPEWLMHTSVWRNRSDLDTMSLDDLYNHLKQNTGVETKKLTLLVFPLLALMFPHIGAASIHQDTDCAYIASQSCGSQIKFKDINQIDEDDMEEMDIKWNMALLSMRADRWATLQGSAELPEAKTEEEETITDKGLRVDHRSSWAKNNNTHKSKSPRPAAHKTHRLQMRPIRPNVNVAQPKRTSFYKPAHSYNKRPFQRTSAVRSQFRGPRVATINKKFPTVNRKLLSVNRKFPTGNTKFSTADLGNKGKAGSSQNNIDDKGYWDSGCSRHMTSNISYISEYEPFDGGYVSFSQGGCKITGKGTIKTNEGMLWHKRLGKQHKASCKTKLVNSVTKPLHTLHMDLFGPTFDETSGILRNFITEIENLKELRVKIIRCDNEGEFRNKETNDFCLKKGFLKPFGYHVMILNTLNNLEKFEAKGDEGYFLGYSMSSKVFRVFNKRTKRVEENLHVDFLENKPIEKGTNSTNFLGTKEAAGQDVKRDVSSLGYIVLLNWFHEAHLESSPSNAQDSCGADAPESSGNSNPTATLTNPSADHMETLAVETLIPTPSSPAPTACLNDSPEPSSDARLISKRVTNQDDTPCLDNILSLTNRFEDILGVTTNTDDTNEVEADLGNMETTITASPTPTLRIHKDHPKS